MGLIRSVLPIAIGLFLTIAAPIFLRAEETVDSAAARYIRTLFDATLHEDADLSGRCADIEAFGRAAAGRLWRALPEKERAQFDRDFCALASDAIARIRGAYPGLTLEIATSHAAPQDMVTVQGVVTLPGAQQWQLDWLVTGLPEPPHLSDLRILGVSLGIFLHSLAATQWPDKAPESLTSAEILRPWRQVLDRALPPPDAASPR